MQAASSPSIYDPAASGRSRLASFVLALGFTALVLWMLLWLGVVPPIPRRLQPPLVVQLLPGEHAEATRSPSAAKPASGSRAAAAPRRSPALVPPSAPPPVKARPVPWNVTPLSGAQFAATDIGALPSHAAGTSGRGDAAGQGDADGGDGNGAGQGAGSERLYQADWYRKPTDAEMATYMPSNVRTGWGEIACRTAPDYRVEDCRELGETPGSGFSRAMRQAAWQFRVLPPRINHRSLVGEWVRIHYDFLEARAAG